MHSERRDARAAGGTRDHFFVTVGARARLPGQHSTHVLQPGLPGRFSVRIATDARVPEAQLRLPSQLNRSGTGWNNFAQHATHLPGDPSDLAWWGPFIRDGRVRITAQYTDERISNRECIVEPEIDSDDEEDPPEDSDDADSCAHTSDEDRE